jgi:hypothetical protein
MRYFVVLHGELGAQNIDVQAHRPGASRLLFTLEAPPGSDLKALLSERVLPLAVRNALGAVEGTFKSYEEARLMASAVESATGAQARIEGKDGSEVWPLAPE